ncbi:MAG: ribonuclease, partial [Frankiales bacterium]|nr:ribonuclease [Frankiales bacterium]
CLGRDRTKHQVAEVTSLGLVQMTRKRVGEGLLEAFSEPCEHCKGRGVIVHSEPVEKRSAVSGPASTDEDERPARNKRNRRGKTAEPIEEAPVLDPEKRRAAASAIAAIAAATGHHEGGAVEIASEATGRTELVPQTVELAMAAVEVALDAEPESSNGHGFNGSQPTATPSQGGSSRPRRRRGASRPAGPPAPSSGAAQTVS